MQLQNKHSTYNYELKENKTLKDITKFAKLSKYSNLKGFTSQINVTINIRSNLSSLQDQERYNWSLEDSDKLSDAPRFDEFSNFQTFKGEFAQISVSNVETPVPPKVVLPKAMPTPEPPTTNKKPTKSSKTPKNK